MIFDLPLVALAGRSTTSSAHMPEAPSLLGAHWAASWPSTSTLATWRPMAGSIRRVSLTPSLAGSIATVNSLEPFPPNARPSSARVSGRTCSACGSRRLICDSRPEPDVLASRTDRPGASESLASCVRAPGSAGLGSPPALSRSMTSWAGSAGSNVRTPSASAKVR
ncbi:hypothetical protein GCM10020220_050000 [Nonomuraea rubra]